MDYTVVRPSEITNDPSAVQMTYPPVGQQAIPTYLMAVPGDADPKVSKIPVPSGISKSDVADLLVMSALGEREDDATRKEGYKGFLRRSTVICCSQKGGDAFSPRTFRDIMGRVRVSQGKGYVDQNYQIRLVYLEEREGYPSFLLAYYVMWSGASESIDLILSHPTIKLAYHISIILISTIFIYKH